MLVTDDNAFWYIVQCFPQNERKAVEEIRRAGFRAYLPKAGRVIRHHRTKQVSIKRSPALTGYVFMRFPSGQPNWYALRQCQGVKGVLYCDSKPYRLHRERVASLMRAQRALDYDLKDARQYRSARRRGEKESIDRALIKARFHRGAKVRSSTGPFASLIAEVKHVTSRGTVQAIANIFGADVNVEFSMGNGIESLDLVA